VTNINDPTVNTIEDALINGIVSFALHSMKQEPENDNETTSPSSRRPDPIAEPDDQAVALIFESEISREPIREIPPSPPLPRKFPDPSDAIPIEP
jgi:hypothetical protein